MAKKAQYQQLIYWVRKNKANKEKLLAFIEAQYAVILSYDNLESFIKVMFEAKTCDCIFNDLLIAAGLAEPTEKECLL